jgi:hypothetical protein
VLGTLWNAARALPARRPRPRPCNSWSARQTTQCNLNEARRLPAETSPFRAGVPKVAQLLLGAGWTCQPSTGSQQPRASKLCSTNQLERVNREIADAPTMLV